MTSYAVLIFAIAACAWIVVRAMDDHRQAMRMRHRLLDEAPGLIAEPATSLAPDQFPVVCGRIEDGRRVRIELVADTMVVRRLPQLWLRVTLVEREAQARPKIGALARPTGAEYYSMVHDMPEWITPPQTGASLLMRGDGTGTSAQAAEISLYFQQLFADPLVKEAVITPLGARIMRQAAQGDRAAHLVLRQSRFPLTIVPADTIRHAIDAVISLAAALAVPPLSETNRAA
ncbi:hypothetical protein JJB09_06055 [Rhizobium sp. KVB221]|uniref:Uncharacterized protein n=1 Tax=Rhizobium setariae TaxID=2801340 RepID=A0A937CJX9_9HYPH|nr:hypothetical protein [Rhizobium setariae]MBL0371585.1 hypothetical protein [Rhizobium setariae]